MKSKNMSKILMDNILYICLLLMIVIIAIISPSFISVRVLSDVLTQSAPKMLLAVGMLVVIIAGGMDMTVGRLAGLGAVVSEHLHSSPLITLNSGRHCRKCH